ncbi:MAG: hypothetical protein ACYS0K_21710 [Planctomycetota bacterium]|jgi:hypothetical protein
MNAKKRKKKGGRPRKPKSWRLTVTPTIRFKELDWSLIQLAAEMKGVPTTRWAREALVRVARNTLKRGKISTKKERK